MKNYIGTITTLIVLFITANVAAQYNEDSMRQYGGVDRSLTGEQYGNKKKKMTDDEYLDSYMTQMTSNLSLDGFQVAVIRQLLTDDHVQETKVMEEDIPNESKTEKITGLREKLNGKIKDILTPEQKEKFDKTVKKKKK